MLARLPEQEYIWPSLAGKCRAHQLVIVPESLVTIALAGSLEPSSWATTCGFIGILVSLACVSNRSHHFFIPDCAPSRKLRSSFLFSSGSRASRVLRLSPINADSTGDRNAIRAGLMSI